MSEIEIGFHLIDENANEFSQKSSMEVFTDLGDTVLDAIGRQLNNFLKQCGYIRPNEHIFMEDLTDDEYDAITDFLADYRENQKGATL